MKSLIKILPLVFGLSFLSTGCYTVVWDPSQEFPNDQSYSDSTDFYDTDYYGGYYGFYETPWWITFPPYIANPNYDQGNAITRDRSNTRSGEVESTRNNGGRGYTNDNGRTTLPPPTVSSGSSGSASTSKTRDSGSDNNNTNTSSSNSSSSSNNNNGRSSGSSNTRDDSGSRNSGSGRR
jgi:hypothetical protein